MPPGESGSDERPARRTDLLPRLLPRVGAFAVLLPPSTLDGQRYEKRRDPALFIGILVGGPNGIRTRVSALRGPCPRPLDDGAEPNRECTRMSWLGEEDSNPRYQGQNLASYP